METIHPYWDGRDTRPRQPILIPPQMSRLLDKSAPSPNPAPQSPLQHLCSLLDSHVPVVDPTCWQLLAWNLLVMVAILFNFFTIPIAFFMTEQVYYSQTNSPLGLSLNLFFLCVLCVDTVLARPSIAVYHRGSYLTRRLYILPQYLRLQFWLNSLSVLVLLAYLTAQSPQLIYLKLLFYLRVYNLVVVDRQIAHRLHSHRVWYAGYRILRMLMWLWFVSSLAASVFFAIDYSYYLEQGQYYQSGQLWLLNSYAVGNLDLLHNYEWPTWYSYALYWAIATGSTVGYGDLTPLNPPEVFLTIVVVLVMTILWAFYVNVVWAIVGGLRDGVVGGASWAHLMGYLRVAQLRPGLKTSIRGCMHQHWRQEQNKEVEEEIINKHISTRLRDQFYRQHRGKFFQTVPLFVQWLHRHHPSPVLLTLLVHLLSTRILPQDHALYQPGHVQPSMYYVVEGMIRAYIPQSSMECWAGEGAVLGVEQFFRETARDHGTVATVHSRVWVLDRPGLLQAIRGHRQFREKFSEYRHRVVVDHETALTGTKCWKCRSAGHFTSLCPVLNEWRDIVGICKEQRVREWDRATMRRQDHGRDNRKQAKVRQGMSRRRQGQLDCFEGVYNCRSYFPYFNISQ